ncbi:hypothetical protein JZU68_02005, partial [bacterium]|nr:hypothetical protein [bacterium]
YANWLNPDSAKADGTYSDAYLTSVYSSPIFKDAWAAFRYLNSKGIEPIFNVSGRVPPQWNEPNTLILQNFDAYSTMLCTMLQWAKEKEGLKFSKLMPFNETDFDGTREGPSIPTINRAKALNSMLNKLNQYGFGYLKVIAFCDADFKTEYLQPLVDDTT